MGTNLFSALAIGTLLNERYEIVEILGQGGYGRAYMARDKRLQDKIWAVKEIYSPKESIDTFSLANENFLKEASILCTLSHPNIPQVIDYFSIDQRHYIVMEYVAGKTLHEKYSSEKRLWDQEEIVSFSLDMCNLLEYLHSHSVVFRDLKPQNIMIDNNQKPKLIDFGIARHFKSYQGTDTINIGTPGYAAPEQYGKRGGSDQRTDVYSLGVILHYLASGEDPQEKEEPFKFSSIKDINAKISEGLISIIHKCISLNKTERFQNITELYEVLKDINNKNYMASPVEFSIQPVQDRQVPQTSQKEYSPTVPPSGSKIILETLGKDELIIDIPPRGPTWWLMPPTVFLLSFVLFSFYILIKLFLFSNIGLPAVYFFQGILGLILPALISVELLERMFGKLTMEFNKGYLKLKSKWLGLIPKEKTYPLDEIAEFNIEKKILEEKVNFYHKLEKRNLPVNLSGLENKWLSQELNRILNFFKKEE